MGKRVKRSRSRSFKRFLALLIVIGIVAFLLWLFSPVIPTWIKQNQKSILTIVSGFVLAYTVFRFISDKPRHSLSKFLLWIFLLASLGYLLWIYVIPPVLLWVRQHLGIIVLSIVTALLLAISLAIWRYKPDAWESILTRIKTLFGPEHPPPPPPPPLPPTGKEGYIYISRCPAHEEKLYKIGRTKRPPTTRIKETSGTGVPEEFILLRSWRVSDDVAAELLVFKALEKYRLNPKREFFKGELDTIMSIMKATIKDLIISEEYDEEYGSYGGSTPASQTATPSTKLSEIEELDKLLHSEDYTIGKLVGFFKLNLEKEYEADAGVWEKITVELHTQRVLKQFEKYFGNMELPGHVDPMFFRTILALHDVGVSHAIDKGSQEGKDTRSAKKMYQGTFNKYLMKRELDRLQFSPKEINIASALVSADPLGYYFRKNNIKNAANTIKRMAIESGLKTEEFFELLKIFYMVDAGSYTIDAGGQKGLDRLFVFNHSQMRMYFAKNVAYKMDKLWRHIQSNN
jgi:hypothetical protein